MSDANSIQANGTEKNYVMPARIRLPITAALFLLGAVITISVAFQPTDDTDLVKGFAETFANLLKGLLWGLPFTLSAQVFNAVFKPRTPGERSPDTPRREADDGTSSVAAVAAATVLHAGTDGSTGAGVHAGTDCGGDGGGSC